MANAVAQRRKHYRVCYPEGRRPTLATPYGDYEIVDLSERAVKLLYTAEEEFERGAELCGEITSLSEQRCEVTGVVRRLDEKEKMAVLGLTEPLRSKWVRLEELFLIREARKRHR